MKKKILSLCLVVVLAATAVMGASMAYLQDTDSDVNVMTLGNVKIAQHEYQRVTNDDGTYKTDTIDSQTSYVLEAFEQGKALLPIVGDPSSPDGYPYAGYDTTRVRMTQVDSYGNADVFAGKNAQDKFVTVENTGKTDAYVRTLIAFETGSTNAVVDGLIATEIRAGEEANGVQPWTYGDTGTVAIDGNNYFYFELIYTGAMLSTGDWRHGNGVLPAGDTTYPNLCQVYLASEATNEDVEALDGNDNGTYDILVLSQAVQTAGFADAQTALDTGFGEATAANVKAWFEDVAGIIDSADEVYDSTKTSGSYKLGADINTSAAESHYNGNREYAIRDGVVYTINLNGRTINHDGTYQNGSSTGYTYLYTTAYNGKLTINGEGTINSANSEGNAVIVYAQGPSEVVINGGDFNVDKGIAVWAGNNSKVTINGGSFISTGSDDEELIYSSGGVIDIYGGFFHNTLQDDRPVNVANANRSTGFINIYGGTFVNFDPSFGGDDPGNIKVMDGYKVVSETQTNGDVWYTVVPK